MTDESDLSRIVGLKIESKCGHGSDSEFGMLALRCDRMRLAQYIHELRGCARSIKILLQMIEDGEQFDAGDNNTLLAQVKESTYALQPIISVLREIHTGS
jgi:hypothetical protein